MANKKLETREQITRHYIDKAMNSGTTYNIDKLLLEVEAIVDVIMKAREMDINGEFYRTLEKELND